MHDQLLQKNKDGALYCANILSREEFCAREHIDPIEEVKERIEMDERCKVLKDKRNNEWFDVTDLFCHNDMTQGAIACTKDEYCLGCFDQMRVREAMNSRGGWYTLYTTRGV